MKLFRLFLDIPKKNSRQKNSSKISEKLQQIIQWLNILPTRINFFHQKRQYSIDFCTKTNPNWSFSTWLSLKSGNFVHQVFTISKLEIVAEKRPKKAWAISVLIGFISSQMGNKSRIKVLLVSCIELLSEFIYRTTVKLWWLRNAEKWRLYNVCTKMA